MAYRSFAKTNKKLECLFAKTIKTLENYANYKSYENKAGPHFKWLHSICKFTRSKFNFLN